MTSSSCATARWWKRALPPRLFAAPKDDYTKALLAAAFNIEAVEIAGSASS